MYVRWPLTIIETPGQQCCCWCSLDWCKYLMMRWTHTQHSISTHSACTVHDLHRTYTTHTCTHTHTRTHTHTSHTHTRTHKHTHTHAHTHITYTHITYMYTHTHPSTHAHAKSSSLHTHTHTHTHSCACTQKNVDNHNSVSWVVLTNNGWV